MLIKVLRNSEARKYLLVLLIVQIVFMMILFWQNGKNTQRLNTVILDEKISTIGYILKNNPESKDEAITFLTEKASEEEISVGLEEARKYGIDQKLSMDFNKPLLDYQRANNRIVALSLATLFAVTITITIGLLNKIYKRIRDFSIYAEHVVEGNFETILEEHDEGDFAKLTNQFNNMAKRLQSSLESLNEEKIYLKNIISDISHQLKTPLTSIKMFNELLIDGELENTEVLSDFLHISQVQIERMEWLIINLLKMAKLETRSIEFDIKEHDLNETIKRALIPLWDMARDKDVSIYMELSKSLHLRHDENWLGEAVSNIVRNAIEQSEENDNIYVEVTETPLAAKIVVKDEAGGIDQEDILHVFDRFYKGKNSKNSNSTGIGLSLAKAIVENHNGTITVKNQAKGAIFTIILYKDESY